MKDWIDFMNKVTLHREDVANIKKFIDKYTTSDFVTIGVDSSSGIGSIVVVSINAMVNDDMVLITKTIVDESSW